MLRGSVYKSDMYTVAAGPATAVTAAASEIHLARCHASHRAR